MYKKEYDEIKKKLKGYKSYFTIDNDNKKSFLVYLKKDIFIYKKIIINSIDEDKIKNPKSLYVNLIDHFNPEKIFIGKSLNIKNSSIHINYGKKYDGNTFLLHMENNDYIFIKDNVIQKFTTPDNDKIINYYSFLLEHDTPLPIAIGEKYIYFFNFIEGYLSKSEFETIKKKDNLKKIIEKGIKIDKFLYSIDTHKPKHNIISLEELKKLKTKNLTDIPLKTIKNLAKIYHVTESGSKKEIIDRIEKLRNVIDLLIY